MGGEFHGYLSLKTTGVNEVKLFSAEFSRARGAVGISR